MNAGLKTHWEPQPAGAAWVTRTLAHCSSENAVLRDFADLLHTTAGTRLADWVDYLHVPTSAGLQAAGFQLAADGWYQHPAALLPPVCVSGRSIVALRVDSVSDFAVACSHRFPIEVLGQAGDRCVLDILVKHLVINLVGKDHQAMLSRQAHDALEQLVRVQRSRGVVGGQNDQSLGLRGHGLFD